MEIYGKDLLAEANRIARRASAERPSKKHVRQAADRIGVLRDRAGVASDLALAVGSILIGAAVSYQVNLWTGGKATHGAGIWMTVALAAGGWRRGGRGCCHDQGAEVLRPDEDTRGSRLKSVRTVGGLAPKTKLPGMSEPRDTIRYVSDEMWRPLGVDTEEQVAAYDALHDDVPAWMWSAFWAWVKEGVTVIGHYGDGSGRFPMLDESLTEQMCQRLRINLPNLRTPSRDPGAGLRQLNGAMQALGKHGHPLQIADYLLSHEGHAAAAALNALLERSKSAWEVGIRHGKPGLVRRVPLGVQVSADAVMERAGRAGVRLAQAWGELYGLDPNASEAYRLAILAVEDAAVPVVSPTNTGASLGTVLKQIEDQGNWKLPMDREHANAPTGEVLVGMMRMLWHGQHDRHGGQPSAPGNVSLDEASVAVSLAVTLVNWFHSGSIRRESAKGK
jgi:hypothetical protein